MKWKNNLTSVVYQTCRFMRPLVKLSVVNDKIPIFISSNLNLTVNYKKISKTRENIHKKEITLNYLLKIRKKWLYIY